MNKKQKLETRIKDLQERISMNNHEIECGEDSHMRMISRGDNKFCKGRLKELMKELFVLVGEGVA